MPSRSGHDGRVTSAPTRMVLIRHGESHANAGSFFSGETTCRGLSDRGRAEAELLRDRLAADDDLRPDAVLSSTMLRAQQTAEIVTEGMSIPVSAVSELCERRWGECEGLTYTEYEERYGIPAFSEWQRPLSPGGESNTEFHARVAAVLSGIAEEHRGRTVWIVCHGGVIMGAMALWTPDPVFAAENKPPRNTAISEWRQDHATDGAWHLHTYDDHAHLVGMDAG